MWALIICELIAANNCQAMQGDGLLSPEFNSDLERRRCLCFNPQMKPSAILAGLLAVFLQSITLFAAQPSRFFKAECLTSAGYIKLAVDGTYRVLWREHAGVFVQEQGRWSQKQEVVTFTPSNGKKASYKGTEVKYKGKTFLAWESEHAPGIVIPVGETEKELDSGPKQAPWYVFFETDGLVYQRETEESYPFHFVKPIGP